MLGTGCGKTTIRRSSTPCELANTGGSTKLVASATLGPHSRAATMAAGRIHGSRAYRRFGKTNGMLSLMCCRGRDGRRTMDKKRRPASLDGIT